MLAIMRFLIIIVIPALLLLLGCSKEDTSNNPANQNPYGVLISHTSCKNGSVSKGSDGKIQTTDQDCLEYQYDKNGILTLKHVNTGFNCCVDNLVAVVRIEGSEITIEESENAPTPCDCLCLYDMKMEIRNLAAGKYTIKIIEPYVPESKEKLEFQIDLLQSPGGSYCVKRDFYPWGM